jgi:tRNA-dihydrouridine synthase B
MDIKNKLFLAPLAGINDRSFRQICKNNGADICFTGMISSEALIRDIPEILNEAKTSLSEKPVGIQLFGNNPIMIVEAARKIKKTCDIIDLNCGCPDSSIRKQGSGASLLNNPIIIFKTIVELKELTKDSDILITAKIRIGINAHSWRKTEELVKGMENAGIDALIVHPRTAKQGYSGKADWKIIKRIKDTLSIPVIGNGDIITPEDAKKMYIKTGCDALMIGRAAMKNPFIFQDIKDYLKTGTINKHTKKERINLINEYIYLAKDADLSFAKIRNHIIMFLYDFSGSSDMRARIAKVKSLDLIRNILDKSLTL